MKRFFVRSLALLLVAALGLSMCVFTSAASLTYTTGHTVVAGVNYAKYSMAGATTQPVTVLTFNPKDGYIPMAFMGYAGTSATLATQYSIAQDKYGYEVAGAINGSFFSMDSATPTYGNYGTLVGLSVSNGKIASAHIGYQDSVVTFASDGTMKICESALKFNLTINGQSYDDMIYYINKTSGSKIASHWSDRFYYYDTSCGSKADTFAICPGTEILCKKVNNTDIAIGQTLVGEVLSIKENTYGGSIDTAGIESDNFILFIKSDSVYQSYIDGLQVGSQVKIRTEETIESSRATMENANSVITNVGWLVKNGINQTLLQSTIGTHSVTLQARWTAFGTKPDGTYVFFTSEGGSTGSSALTLKNVASAMIELGCTNVIRMDGGGSSGMYVSNTGSGSAGYVQSSSRALADCILVVKRSSVQKPTLNTALSTAISNATTENQSFSISELTQYIANAQTVLGSATSVSGDIKREIMKLNQYIGGENLLAKLTETADSISANSYSDRALDRIDIATQEAKRMLKSASADENTLKSFALKLSNLLKDSSSNYSRISLGKAYDGQSSYASYPDSGGELTDGTVFGGGADYSQWTAFHISQATGIENGAYYADVMIDLGSQQEINGFGASILNYTPWGISVANGVKMLVSSDGKDFYVHSTLTREIDPETGAYQIIGFDSVSETVCARYVVFRLYYSSNFIFVGELSVYGPGNTQGAELTGIDITIYTDYAVVYTPDKGTLIQSNSNASWSHLYICTYDSTLGCYRLSGTQYFGGNTSYSLAVPENGLVIGLHGNARGTNAANAQVGDRVYLQGIDIKAKTFSPGAKILFGTPVSETPEYSAPAISQISTQSDVTIDGSFLYLPTGQLTEDQLKQIVLDPRAEYSKSVISTGTTVSIDATGSSFTFVRMGDISGDGTTTAIDYLLLKRMVLGTYSDTEAQNRAGRVSGNDTISSTDYLIVKRIVLGTYEL